MGARPHRIEVIARGVAIVKGRILLCRSVEGGYTYLPGGHVEAGEPAVQALERELLEETGLAVRAAGLLVVHEERFQQGGAPHHEMNLVFHMEHEGGWPERVESLEPAIAFEWVPLTDLKGARLLPARMRVWLAEQHGGPGVDWLGGD